MQKIQVMNSEVFKLLLLSLLFTLSTYLLVTQLFSFSKGQDIPTGVYNSLISKPVNAEELVSPNFQMTIKQNYGSVDEATSATSNFISTSNIDDMIAETLLTSASYKAQDGTIPAFIANVPKIACFETDTVGSSSCTAPTYVASDGMITVCGPHGCYNRARFEIDPQGNPSDTLYSIQISTDSSFATYRIIDGTTFAPKASSTKSIADYQTEATWEGTTLNLRGITPSTTYYIRATALHGNLTESEPGPYATATTTNPYLEMSIDIADTSGAPSTNPPHNLSIVLPPDFIQEANNLIWLNVGTNYQTGFRISNFGKYGGLSDGTTLSVESKTADLATSTDGFGLQHYTSSQQYDTGNGGELSTISPVANYRSTYLGGTDNVGIISKDPTTTNTYYSEGPIYTGKCALKVKGKVRSANPAGVFTEEVYFVMTTKASGIINSGAPSSDPIR